MHIVYVVLVNSSVVFLTKLTIREMKEMLARRTNLFFRLWKKLWEAINSPALSIANRSFFSSEVRSQLVSTLLGSAINWLRNFGSVYRRANAISNDCALNSTSFMLKRLISRFSQYPLCIVNLIKKRLKFWIFTISLDNHG